MAKRSTVRKKLAPKIHTAIRLRPEVIEMLRMAAAYHKVGYQTYLQWLVEEGLRKEAGYYGWAQPAKRYVVVKKRMTAEQRNALYRVLRYAERQVKDSS